MKANGRHEYNLSERVTQYLVKHIQQNDLKPGDRVPSEVQVSGYLGISRGVVRQAYHSLRKAGILEIAMGRSPRVGELSPDAFTPLFVHALSTEQASVADVLELRSAVEIRAAELAAIHRKSGHVETLRKAIEGMRQTVNDLDRFARIDVRFHQVIGNATGNVLFEIFGRALRGSYESSIRTGLRSRSTLAQIEKIVDNDGYEDLYIAGVNRNQLLHNDGGHKFSDVTKQAGVEGLVPDYGKGWGQSAGWFDCDNDGDLDLLVVNYVRWSLATELKCKVGNARTYCAPENYEGLPNILYRNSGDGTFTDVSSAAGIGDKIGKGMGVAFADYDGDGFTDIFVANDTLRSFLFRNKGDSTFTELAVMAGVAFNQNGKSIAGMGVDFRDVDNDGLPDVFVTGMVNDTFPLYKNGGRGFEDVTGRTGVARATMRVTGWSAGIFDFDNDGRKDLYAALGAILDNSMEVQNLPAKLPNMILHNQGARFSNAGPEAGPDFNQKRMHRGAAFGDLNNDGRVDIVTSSLNEPAEILLNVSPEANHWLILKLEGRQSNRDGIGAKIRIEPEGGVAQVNHATTAVGLSSSSDRRVHFGLGASKLVKTIEIDWPSGKKQRLENVAADQILGVVEEAK